MKLFKPTKSNNGALLAVNFVAKADAYEAGKVKQRGDKSVYFSFVAQNGWDDKNGNGIFKDGRRCNIKFNDIEAAAIIAAVRANKTMADVMNVKMVYHDGDNSATVINFGPKIKKIKNAQGQWIETGEQQGFVMSITKTDKTNPANKENYGLGFTYAESERLVSYLNTALSHINDALFSEEIKRVQTFAAAQNVPKTAPKAAAKEEYLPSEPEEAVVDEPAPSEEELDTW